MERNLNHSSIEAYSVAYAKKVNSDFFNNQDSITGKQIVSLCNIRQINFFVLKILFTKWKNETEKLESPYFNFKDKEVSEALTHFMNVLSQKILVKRADFEPLLVKAVYDTLLLIFSPFEYFAKEINNPEKTRISLEDLHELGKYVKINSEVLQNLITKFKNKNIREVYNDEGYNLLIEVFEENEPAQIEDHSDYFELFSQVVPLTPDVIYEEEEEEIEPNEEIPHLFVHKEDEQEKEVAANNFFNQQLTLNEKLNSKAKATLADIHQKKKIDNIKKHISIYQRFMFINELFNGKVDEFDTAVESLDLCEDYQEALNFIEKDYMRKYRWNTESEEVNEFLEILAKRFN